jgi:hypothetical protein
MLHIKGFQSLDDVVGCFAGDIGGELVAGGIERGIGQQHDVGDAGLLVQDPEDGFTQIGRRYDA